MKAIQVNALDNVATALDDLHKGETILGVDICQDIAKGHKFAVRAIAAGDPIIKYAAHIGLAKRNIKEGEWVHVHNLVGERGRGDIKDTVLEVQPLEMSQRLVVDCKKTYDLQGYRRPDGTFGFRNHILIMPSVHCANRVVERIANTLIYGTEDSNEDTRIVYVMHQHGCSELSYDAAQTKRVLVGNGTNPNVWGVLIVGLGCEGVQAADVAEEILQHTPYKRVEYLSIQETGGSNKTVAAGIEIARDMLHEALLEKKSAGTLRDVILGTECGGSDSFSGLSANPALGRVSDVVIQQGGRVILAETTELIGAEHLLAARAINKTVQKQVLKTILGFEQAVLDSHADIRGANPSPGNIAGGLSSIEEKSLGCIYKAGHQPVQAVIEYANMVSEQGLTLMNTPGNDIEQLSGMAAGGCNVCVFTTGRGTPTGSPIVPTIKVSSNTAVFHSMSDCIDLNAGTVVEGRQTIEEVGEEILEFIVKMSNGEQTKAELNQQNDFSIWRLATTV